MPSVGPAHPTQKEIHRWSAACKKFGKTDMRVSVLGFGGAEIGFEGASDDTVERLLGDALDAGLNVIDTAECYMDSEEKIGRAVAHRRGDFHLFTKCGHPEKPGVGDCGLPRSRSWRASSGTSSRLKTDRVDLVQAPQLLASTT